jgi:hypothetical protein
LIRFGNRPAEDRAAQSRLQSSFDEITSRLGFGDRKPKILFVRSDSGARHYERVGEGWDAVVTERGSEFERTRLCSDAEALFQLAGDLTFGMAVEYELNNRDESEDCRVKISNFQIDLMGKVSEEWQRRIEDKWRGILGRYPLHERNRGDLA